LSFRGPRLSRTPRDVQTVQSGPVRRRSEVVQVDVRRGDRGVPEPGERIAAAPGHKRIRELEDRCRQFVSCVRRCVSGLWPRWGGDPLGICPISSRQAWSCPHQQP